MPIAEGPAYCGAKREGRGPGSLRGAAINGSMRCVASLSTDAVGWLGVRCFREAVFGCLV